MESITEHFVDGLYKLSIEEFSTHVIEEAKKCVLDYLGVTYVGAHILKVRSNFSLDTFDNHGTVPVIGLDKKVAMQDAILFNGIHSHVVELDDGHRVAMMHPGAPIISALLPLALHKKISGTDFLRGIIVGYEAAIRLASALQPSLKQNGFHGTGIAGTVGVAVAIATSLKFNKEQLKNAVDASTTSASGILKVIKDISELKPYNVGNAAQSGYVAAMLGLSGFKGPYDTLGGKLGFLSMMSDSVKLNFLDFKKRETLSLLKIYRKPYAACRHCHSPIEAALALRKSNTLEINEVKSIVVRTYSLAVAGHEHADIVSVNSAKMSIPYSIAVALIKGKAELSEFTEEAINDANILALTKLVTVYEDADLTALVPEKRAAIVSMETKNGAVYTERVDYPKGEPENSISDSDLRDKFTSLALYSGKTNEECAAIIHIINNLELEFLKLVEYL